MGVNGVPYSEAAHNHGADTDAANTAAQVTPRAVGK